MSTESERLDRLEAVVAKALNIDFSEFDTPSQATARAKELKQAQEIQKQQLVVEQREAGVTAAEDRIAAEQAAGRKDAPAHPSVSELTAGPRHLLTDGTTGGPQPSDTGKPRSSTKTSSSRKTRTSRRSSPGTAAKSSASGKTSAAASGTGTKTSTASNTPPNTAKDQA
jgi:hypothetical protein